MSSLNSYPLLGSRSAASLRLSTAFSSHSRCPQQVQQEHEVKFYSLLSRVDLVLQCQSLGHHVQRAQIRAVGI